MLAARCQRSGIRHTRVRKKTIIATMLKMQISNKFYFAPRIASRMKGEKMFVP